MNTYASLILWILAVELIGALSGIMTKDSLATWYINLKRSPLTPPNYVFGLVWTVLYACIGTVGWFIWQTQNESMGWIKFWFIVQLCLNFSWTPLFFYFHWTGIALLSMIAIIAIVIYLIVALLWLHTWFAVLLMPYLLWLLLACHLNYYIWRYN